MRRSPVTPPRHRLFPRGWESAACAVLVGFFAACSGGGGTPCNSDLCGGCCRGDVCYPGNENLACGSLGSACSDCQAAGQTCGAQGACVGGGTGGGAAGACDAPLQQCGDACVDVATDASHCGGCGTSCSAGSACEAGACTSLPADCTVTACPGQGYYCDLGTRQCKAGCVLDSQCGGTLTHCDVATRTCACQVGSCGPTRYCAGDGRCASGCERDAQCSGETRRCDVARHTCACSDDSCAPGTFCSSDGACRPGCSSSAPCTALNQECNLAKNLCECSSSAHSCNGQCVSNASTNSCGSSCTPCPAAPAHGTATCVSGGCSFRCADEYFKVGAVCYPKQTVSKSTEVGNQTTCQISNSANTSSCDVYITSRLPDLAWLAAGYRATCALSTQGQVYCAGRSTSGELGLAATLSTPAFSRVPNLPSNVVKLALNRQRAFALTATGEVWRWGEGWQGNSTSQPWAVPSVSSPVLFASGAKDIALSSTHLCSIDEDTPTRALCEGGDNGSTGSYGGLYLYAPAGVTLAAVSYDGTGFAGHGCALDVAGKVYCWGQGSKGELGYTSPTTMNQVMKVVPNFPPPGRVAVSVAVMGTNSCAALDNGDLYCWGALGAPQVATPTPKKMPHSGVTSLAANDTFICVTGIPAECLDP